MARQIVLHSQKGLIATYNRLHSADIQQFRDLHHAMDEAVVFPYGWGDLEFCHDFYETAQGVRYIISETARRE
ncbi:MAG: hypothetical protein U0670_14245 [Anaerolineae bacterium]